MGWRGRGNLMMSGNMAKGGNGDDTLMQFGGWRRRKFDDGDGMKRDAK